MQDVVILRGIPGSGKTHYVENTLGFDGESLASSTALVVSTDHFFTDDSTGEYKFNRSKLTEAHSYTRMRFLTALAGRTNLIIVDNTCTRLWEYQEYIHMAETFGANVTVTEMCCPSAEMALLCWERNRHGVPLSDVIRMWEHWEKDDRASLVPITFEEVR